MICKECNNKMELSSLVVPSGKDKEEKALFIYKCKNCGYNQSNETSLGDKGGMTSDL